MLNIYIIYYDYYNYNFYYILFIFFMIWDFANEISGPIVVNKSTSFDPICNWISYKKNI